MLMPHRTDQQAAAGHTTAAMMRGRQVGDHIFKHIPGHGPMPEMKLYVTGEQYICLTPKRGALVVDRAHGTVQAVNSIEKPEDSLERDIVAVLGVSRFATERYRQFHFPSTDMRARSLRHVILCCMPFSSKIICPLPSHAYTGTQGKRLV